MNFLRLIFSIILILALSNCTTQEATDRDYLDGAEGEFHGPGVFSKEEGGLDLEKVFRQMTSNEPANNVQQASTEASKKSLVPSDAESYENFRQWRQERDLSSEEYKEYQTWKEYQEYREYLRFRDSQQ